MVLSMFSVVMWEWPQLLVWRVRPLGAWVCPQSLRRAEVSLGMMTCRGIPCAWFAEEMRMVGLVPKKVSVSWGADQDLRLSRVRYRGEPSLYASSLVPGSLKRSQACPSWSTWGKVASSDAVDPMKPELWALKNTESSWLLFSEGRSSSSMLRRSSGRGTWPL